jgi:uncharacterized membrane protein
MWGLLKWRWNAPALFRLFRARFDFLLLLRDALHRNTTEVLSAEQEHAGEQCVCTTQEKNCFAIPISCVAVCCFCIFISLGARFFALCIEACFIVVVSLLFVWQSRSGRNMVGQWLSLVYYEHSKIVWSVMKSKIQLHSLGGGCHMMSLRFDVDVLIHEHRVILLRFTNAMCSY